jgi:hypothetical protein
VNTVPREALSVLGIDPGARSFGFVGALRLGGKWIISSSGSHTVEESVRDLAEAARRQVEWWGSEKRYPAGVDIVAIEGYEYQGKRTSGPQALILPWVIGWLERDTAELVGTRTIVVPRTQSFNHWGVGRDSEKTRTSNRPEVRAALRTVFGESASLLKNEHERSAAMVVVAATARASAPRVRR